MLLSKAIGGIGFPLSVVVYHERLDRWQPGAHAGTFRGNQLAMVAGAAAIAYMREHDVPGHAARVGAQLLADLRSALGGHELVRDIRGRGLMIGIEMASPRSARALRDACLELGLIVELGGREDVVLRLLPPLVITDNLARRISEIVAAAIVSLSPATAIRQSAML